MVKQDSWNWVKMDESAKMSGLDLEQVKSYYATNDSIKQNMMYAIREEKTFDKLKSELTIK